MTAMTPFQRVNAVLQRQTPDCVPVFPTLLMQGARELGLSLETYFSQGETLDIGKAEPLYLRPSEAERSAGGFIGDAASSH